MKRIFQVLFVGFFLLVAGVLQAQSMKKSTAAPKAKLLRHVVLFKFKDGTTPEQVKSLEDAFAGLRSQIKEIKDFEFGLNNSPENLNQGFTHCFVATFTSEKDRDTYLPHPAHKAFVDNFAKPYVEKACVVDYWTSK